MSREMKSTPYIADAHAPSLFRPSAPSLSLADPFLKGALQDAERPLPVDGHDDVLDLIGTLKRLATAADGGKRDHMVTATRAMIDSINGTYGTTGAIALSAEEKGSVEWNWQYQRAMEMKEANRDQRKAKAAIIVKLCNDFANTAHRIGRNIINDLAEPADRRLIRASSSSLTGASHGQLAWIVKGILFKLSSDVMLPAPSGTPSGFLYGGGRPSVELANKAAGHQLKGANAYFNGDADNELRVPIQALIDYAGFRLIATPVLPVVDPVRSVVYGSVDAGHTVNTDNVRINDLMKLHASRLHIKRHKVSGKEIWSAGDVSAHQGNDGRFYLQNLQRSMPPESPLHTKHLVGHSQSLFVRLLRPELLAHLRLKGGAPLSPDALSAWSAGDEEATRHNGEVDNATSILINEIIPSYAAELQSTIHTSREAAALAPTLSAQLHQRGINVRHTGLLRSKVRHPSPTSTLLLVEMLQRTMKNMLRLGLRWMASSTLSALHAGGNGGNTSTGLVSINGTPASGTELRTAIASFLNHITGVSSQAPLFWTQLVATELRQRFGNIALRPVDEVNDVNINTSSASISSLPAGTSGGSYVWSSIRPHLLSIITYVLHSVGFSLSSFTSDAARAAVTGGQGLVGWRWTAADIADGEARIKTLTTWQVARGKLLLAEADERINSVSTGILPLHERDTASRLLTDAATQFNDALQVTPRGSLVYLAIATEHAIATAKQHEINRRYGHADQTLLTHVHLLQSHNRQLLKGASSGTIATTPTNAAAAAAAAAAANGTGPAASNGNGSTTPAKRPGTPLGGASTTPAKPPLVPGTPGKKPSTGSRPSGLPTPTTPRGKNGVAWPKSEAKRRMSTSSTASNGSTTSATSTSSGTSNQSTARSAALRSRTPGPPSRARSNSRSPGTATARAQSRDSRGTGSARDRATSRDPPSSSRSRSPGPASPTTPRGTSAAKKGLPWGRASAKTLPSPGKKGSQTPQSPSPKKETKVESKIPRLIPGGALKGDGKTASGAPASVSFLLTSSSSDAISISGVARDIEAEIARVLVLCRRTIEHMVALWNGRVAVSRRFEHAGGASSYGLLRTVTDWLRHYADPSSPSGSNDGEAEICKRLFESDRVRELLATLALAHTFRSSAITQAFDLIKRVAEPRDGASLPTSDEFSALMNRVYNDDNGNSSAIVQRRAALEMYCTLPRDEIILNAALATRDLRVVAVIQELGCNLDTTGIDRARPHLTLLSLAVVDRDVAKVRRLLEAQASTDARDDAGMTPLMLAAAGGLVELTNSIAAAGAALEARNRDDRTALHIAVLAGQETTTRSLIEARAHVEARDKRDWTPLLMAAATGSASLTQLLLKSGTDLDARTQSGLSPLHVAALAGAETEIDGFTITPSPIADYGMVVGILLTYRANPEARTADQRTPLMMAANVAILHSLLADESADSQLNLMDAQGRSALFHSRTADVARVLIARGADLQILDKDGRNAVFHAANAAVLGVLLGYKEKKKYERAAAANDKKEALQGSLFIPYLSANLPAGDVTPLMHVVSRPWKGINDLDSGVGDSLGLNALLKTDGRAAMVRTLLDAGADWDMRDTSDRTAINRARSAAALHVLLEHVKTSSAGVSAVHDALREQAVGGTPLHNLLRDGYVRAANVVLKTGKVDQQPGILNIMDVDGYQPIYYAAKHGNAAMVRLLFDVGTDISRANRRKQLLIHQVLELPDVTPEVLTIVLERTSADGINERQHNGMTPLMLSVTRAHWVMKQLMTRTELSLNVGGPLGTALHVAIKEKSLPSIGTLLRANANVELPDEDGHRVLHLAAIDNDTELIRVLLEAKADPNAKLQARTPPKPSDGSTPLILNVAAKGDATAVRLLLEAKGEVNTTDRAGRSAISWARELAIEDVLDLLEQARSGTMTSSATTTTAAAVAAASPVNASSSSSRASPVPQSSPRSASPPVDEYPAERKEIAPSAATRDALLAAIKAGDAPLVTSIARAGGNKLLAVVKGKSPLHIAASLPSGDVVDALISCDADPYAKDKDGVTPFGIAVISLQEASLKELLEGSDPRNPSRKPELGQALWIASKELLKYELVVAEVELRAAISSDGKQEAEKKLIEPRRNGDILVRMCNALVTAGADPNGTTGSLAPVYVATLLGRPTLVGSLLLAGARCDATSLLARTWEPGVAQLLIDYKADLTLADERGMPALHAACRESRADVARVILIDGRADPDTRAGPATKTPLHCAAEAGCEAAVRVLLEAKANIASRTNAGVIPHGNATPIHLASAAGHAHVVKQLLEARADPEQRDTNGDACLHVAVRAGHDRVARLLLDAKVALVATNQKGYTPLHIAAEQGHASLVDVLLRRGSPSDAISTDGETPLHRAVLLRRKNADDTNAVTLSPEQRASYERIIRWLINASPHSLELRDTSSRTPGDIASRVRDAPLSSLLRTTEARPLPSIAEPVRAPPEPPLPPRFPALIRLKKEMAALATTAKASQQSQPAASP